MSNEEEWGPNEWEHQKKTDKEVKEKDPLIFVKTVIVLGFLPVIIFGFVWLTMLVF